MLILIGDRILLTNLDFQLRNAKITRFWNRVEILEIIYLLFLKVNKRNKVTTCTFQAHSHCKPWIKPIFLEDISLNFCKPQKSLRGRTFGKTVSNPKRVRIYRPQDGDNSHFCKGFDPFHDRRVTFSKPDYKITEDSIFSEDIHSFFEFVQNIIKRKVSANLFEDLAVHSLNIVFDFENTLFIEFPGTAFCRVHRNPNRNIIFFESRKQFEHTLYFAFH